MIYWNLITFERKNIETKKKLKLRLFETFETQHKNTENNLS